MKIDDKEYDEQEILSKVKQTYLDEVAYMGITNDDLTRFCWTQNKHITIFIVKKFYDITSSYLLAIKQSEKDQIEYLDFLEDTHNIKFEQIPNPEDQLGYIIKKCKPNNLEIREINKKSISYFNCNISDDLIYWLNHYIKEFCKKEYKDTKKSLEQRNVIQDFPFSNKKIFVDKYHFNDMLKTIDDEQFTDELNQCLFAYENEKWFLCAAGLGSCLEHLMLLIIQNHKKEKDLGKNPTASKYIDVFSKPPINIDSRQYRYLNCLFMLRNCVDHHNTGYTSKNICDFLLNGVANVFNDYFLPSIK